MTRSNSELEEIEARENAFEELRALAMEDSQYDGPLEEAVTSPASSAGAQNQKAALNKLLDIVQKRMVALETKPTLGCKHKSFRSSAEEVRKHFGKATSFGG